MHEHKKLEEAKYFYQQMSEHFDDREAFTHALSAFLSAARSVLQYALKEAKTKAGGQSWYDIHMNNSQVLTFFKDKRDTNIHQEPVRPSRHTDVAFRDVLVLRDSFKAVLRDADGNIKQQRSSGPVEAGSEVQRPRETASISHRWVFTDWSGTEDAMTLCQKYMEELEDLVRDGINQGFVSS